MPKRIFCLIFTLISVITGDGQSRDFTRWVNPFIGTGGHGHTFPGATMPFGMVQLSPDTRTDNWDGSSGYHYSDDIIYGFSHTHLSGTGIPDGCDILFMPMVGDPPFNKSTNGFPSKFSHENEKAEPGYYSVKLDKDGILAEMTATKRVGMHRYTLPKTDQMTIVLDLKWRDKLLGFGIRKVSDKRIEGYRRSSSWAKDQIIYFVAEFSKPIKTLFLNKSIPYFIRPGQEFDSDHERLAFQFGPTAGGQILIKVALSPVSIEGARKNLAAEMPGWDFDKVRSDARAAWNKELSKIEVSGGTDAQTTTFYTALYHTMIQPNIFQDVDGSYRGHDGKIHNIATDGVTVLSPGFSRPKAPKKPPKAGTQNSDNYTVFSLWDTFRAAHPLYTIIDQKRTVDFINTFIRIYEQGGRLPVWELWGNETDCMIGYHAVSVIADAMAKGIKGFDYEKAYEAAKHSSELDHFGLAAYKKRGYISMEDDDASVSKTLEYAYDDWCIAQMAKIISQRRIDLHQFGEAIKSRNETALYEARARYFENLFDTRTGFMRPKKNGGFISPFAPNEVTFNYTEGNAWVYSFFVPQDIPRLAGLMGGREYFAGTLIKLFTTNEKLIGREQPDITGLIGQYAHGNEPSHHIAYLFNYAGLPWRTQKYVREILDEFYRPTPEGLIGNEDCGQMSAWYVLSASGFYPVTPGSPVYSFGTPLFPEAVYHLENGKTFAIRAKNLSDKNIYIQNAQLNGVQLRTPSIAHSDIMNGGSLEFIMTGSPVVAAFSEFPSSTVDFVAVPRIELGIGGYIFMSTPTPSAKIFYSLDGTEPTDKSKHYIVPFKVGDDTSGAIKAIAVDANGNHSKVADAKFIKKPNNWTVKITSPYDTQYTGGGDEGLIDGIRGTTNFASGEWQGYQGKTFEAVIDLQKETEIKSVGGGFLQNARSWIWIPAHVEFETSVDGVNFTRVADIQTDVSVQEMTPTIKDYTQTIQPTRARYVRVHAYNFGKIPVWHAGAGGEPWIFVDEILIN